MKTRGAGLFIGAALVALLVWPRKSDANESQLATVDFDPGLFPSDLFPYSFEYADDSFNWNYSIPDIPFVDIPEFEVAGMEKSPVDAFLYMIRSAENRMVKDDAERYFRFYGNSRFSNLSNHPVITGEKRGVPLPAAMCRAAGFPPGCVSTAAGAYQIIKPTWERMREAGAYGPRLPNFGPQSQDEAAKRLLAECGALDAILRGDFNLALSRAAPVWASLPGSTAEQGGVSYAAALNLYQSAMG